MNVDNTVFVHQRDAHGTYLRTICCIWVGTMRFVGVAKAHPKVQWSRKIGREVAWGRAFHLLQCLQGKVTPRKSTKLAMVGMYENMFRFDLSQLPPFIIPDVCWRPRPPKEVRLNPSPHFALSV